MERFARTADALDNEPPTVFPLARPFSNFAFLDQFFPECVPLRRILSQVRQHDGRTMVVEKIGPAEDLQEENDDIAKRCPGFSPSHSAAYRLSFFSNAFSVGSLPVGPWGPSFIGYAIVKVDQIPWQTPAVRVYESVLRLSRHGNNYVRGWQTWPCLVAGTELSIDGYLYAQQNDITNVCAHVALRTAAAPFHALGDMSYREMNEVIGIDHVHAKVGSGAGGLDVQQMVRILEAAGARCFIADYQLPEGKRPRVPFQKYVYGSIESGYPALVFFSTDDPPSGHVIPVFGHTFNEDTWVPCAERSYFRIDEKTRYIPSEAWVSMYLAHDDNWGSNYCIPRGYLDAMRYCDRLADDGQSCPVEPEHVAAVISTMPQGIELSAITAEVIGVDYLLTILPQMPPDVGEWAERLRWYHGLDQLVLRPILIEKDEYIRHLGAVVDWENVPISQAAIGALDQLPEGKLWMVELSAPELFSANRRKVGEVLLQAEVAPQVEKNLETFWLARMPGYFALYDTGGPSQPQYRFLRSGCHGHVELLGCEESTPAQA